MSYHCPVTADVSALKPCHYCGTSDPGSFSPAKSHRPSNPCRPCDAARLLAYRSTHPKTVAQKRRSRELRKVRGHQYDESRRHELRYAYQLTIADYDAIKASQGGLCAICLAPPTDGVHLHVDHDHVCCSGKRSCGHCVRGLLHGACNIKLAHYEKSHDTEDPAFEAYLAAYAKRRAA